ncbi:type II secretion system secretin GspD [Comamonas sp. NLF-1-9]|nr:type II secretion system secretin GspD [Comamonas sp. NLF-1-9]
MAFGAVAIATAALADGAPSAAAPGAAAPETAPLSANEPRILRGTDKVIGAAPAAPRLTGPAISFNFEEAPIAEVVRTILGDLLKVDYVLYPPLNGFVTLATRTPVAPDRAMFLLESALSANGLAMVRDVRGSYHVGPPDAVNAVSPGVRQIDAVTIAPGTGPIIVPLQYIGAGEMANILRPMIPANSLLRVDTVRNLLILAGTRSQAEGWLEIVKTFDVDLLKGMSLGVFPLKYVSVAELESALRVIGGAGSAGAGTPAAQAKPAGQDSKSATPGAPANAAPAITESNPLYGALRLIPIERINSVLVVTPRAAYLDQVRDFIERFDRPTDNGMEPQLNIYKVQNGNSRHLATVLQGIFGGSPAPAYANSGVAPGLAAVTGSTGAFGAPGVVQGPGWRSNGFQNPLGSRSGAVPGGAFGSPGFNTGFGGGFGGGFGLPQATQAQAGVQPGQMQAPVSANIGNVRVMSDDLNNTLLVWGTRAEFEKIEATLKRLDQPPTQVLIEASIVEVTLNDSLAYGLQWAFDGGVGGNYQGIGTLRSGTAAMPAPAANLGVAGTQGFTYSLVNSLSKIRVALNALSKDTKVKMISNPSLMVLDNHQAMMAVGNQIPILSSVTDILSTTGAVTSTVQYRDTGVSLAVTPSVNAGNLVTMQIDQSVTDVADFGSATVNNQPVFMQRQISSKVAVRSGESIVLGGLIKDNETQGKGGVPILHELPIVGGLFGTTTNKGERTELLVILTPKVVRSDVDVRAISDDLRYRMRGLVSLSAEQAPEQPAPLRDTAAGPALAQ